jgi:2-polyprenyl-3-methyl-5-hydroxy-6-metoxy-1,4-benzoquinol methylase
VGVRGRALSGRPGLLSSFLLRQRLAAVAPYLRGDVLDLGCGDGPLIPRVRTAQAYVGVDRVAGRIDRLRAHYPQHEFHRRDLDRDELDLGRRFDTVAMLAIIEHLKRPEHVLAQLGGVLRPGGHVVMTSPSAWGDLVHGGGARIGLFSREAAAEHQGTFSRRRLAAMAASCGLALVRYRRFLLGGNQLFVCRPASRPQA